MKFRPPEQEINYSPIPKKKYAPKTPKPLPEGVQRLIDAGHAPECVVCGSKDRLTFDHITPKSKGGHKGISNGQIMCQPCNVAKKDRDISIEELKNEITNSRPMSGEWFLPLTSGRKNSCI